MAGPNAYGRAGHRSGHAVWFVTDCRWVARGFWWGGTRAKKSLSALWRSLAVCSPEASENLSNYRLRGLSQAFPRLSSSARAIWRLLCSLRIKDRLGLMPVL